MARSHACAPLRSVRQRSAREIITICGSSHRTGEEFTCRVAALSCGLSREANVAVDERVALLGLSTDVFFEAFLAVLSCGAVAVPLNWRWSVKEAQGAVEACGATVLVVDSWTKDLGLGLAEAGSWFRSVVILGADGDAAFPVQSIAASEMLISKFWSAAQGLEQPDNGDALICFTSGSTGKPKPVTISHQSLHAQSLAKIAVCSYKFDDTFLHTAPMFHIGGISSAMAMLMAGAKHVFLPKFCAQKTMDLVIEHNVTALIAVPAMISDVEAFRECLSSVETVLVGGGAMSKRQLDSACKVFPKARLFTAYGMTEACSSITFNGPITQETFQSRFAGFPAPGIEIDIMDGDNDGIGEVLTRGPHVMRGYWGQEKETSLALTPDGWMRTGDIGQLTKDGGLMLLSRVKDMIKSGGENVYAAEVELAIGSHLGVKQVSVVGVEDPRLGELVAALICVKEDWYWKDDTAQEGDSVNVDKESESSYLSVSILKDQCLSEGLSRYKIPKVWLFQRESLPATSLGKVNKALVKKRMENVQQGRLKKIRSRL